MKFIIFALFIVLFAVIVYAEFSAQSVLGKWKNGESLTAKEQAVVEKLEALLSERLVQFNGN